MVLLVLHLQTQTRFLLAQVAAEDSPTCHPRASHQQGSQYGVKELVIAMSNVYTRGPWVTVAIPNVSPALSCQRRRNAIGSVRFIEVMQ